MGTLPAQFTLNLTGSHCAEFLQQEIWVGSTLRQTADVIHINPAFHRFSSRTETSRRKSSDMLGLMAMKVIHGGEKNCWDLLGWYVWPEKNWRHTKTKCGAWKNTICPEGNDINVNKDRKSSFALGTLRLPKKKKWTKDFYADGKSQQNVWSKKGHDRISNNSSAPEQCLFLPLTLNAFAKTYLVWTHVESRNTSLSQETPCTSYIFILHHLGEPRHDTVYLQSYHKLSGCWLRITNLLAAGIHRNMLRFKISLGSAKVPNVCC